MNLNRQYGYSNILVSEVKEGEIVGNGCQRELLFSLSCATEDQRKRKRRWMVMKKACFIFSCVCVRGDMMDSGWHNRIRGIVNLKEGPCHRIRTLICQNCRSWETTSGGEGRELLLIRLFVSDKWRRHKHSALTILNQHTDPGDWVILKTLWMTNMSQTYDPSKKR